MPSKIWYWPLRALELVVCFPATLRGSKNKLPQCVCSDILTLISIVILLQKQGDPCFYKINAIFYYKLQTSVCTGYGCCYNGKCQRGEPWVSWKAARGTYSRINRTVLGPRELIGKPTAYPKHLIGLPKPIIWNPCGEDWVLYMCVSRQRVWIDDVECVILLISYHYL